MELAGSTYLLALAAISITFVSVSTVAVVFRQVQGAVLSDFELLLMRAFLITGLMATIASLVPPLLGLFGIAPSVVWRVSSLALGLAILWRTIYLMSRRLRVGPRSTPPIIFVLNGLTIAAILGLLANAIGVLFGPSVGLYAVAATWLLVNSVITFIISLGRFLVSPKDN